MRLPGFIPPAYVSIPYSDPLGHKGLDLLAPYVPEDFDEFWAGIVDEANQARLYFERSRTDYQPLEDHTVELITFRGSTASSCHGWIAIPKQRNGRMPSFLWVPPYGRESTLPNAYSTRKGMVSMSFNLHGNEAFHQEEYQPSRGYFARGIESPETWIFRKLICDSLIAVRVLQAQLEADEERIAAAGLSQGGGLAIWIGVHSPIVKCVVADLPFLSAMRYTLRGEVYRYPLKEVMDFAATIPLGRERVLYTMSYFDTLNQCTRLKKPALLSLGKKDPAVRPETVKADFEAIPINDKRLIEYETGHDWNPDMIQNNLSWMLSHL